MHADTIGTRVPATEPDWVSVLRAQMRGLRYGVIQLVVHDGRVTQIERTEKTRVGPDGQRSDGGTP